MSKTRQTILEVSKSNFIYNINQIRKCINTDKTDILLVLKDHAYGSHLDEQIELINKANIKIIGVAVTDEGLRLRKLGYTGDILLLNPPTEKELEDISKNNLTIGLGDYSLLNSISKSNNNFKIHIEVDTGMGRTGINPLDVKNFANEIKKVNNIKVEGLYTHFAVSDNPKKDNYTLNQIKLFNDSLNILNKIFNLKYIHACNSTGIISFPQAHFTLVRPGIILYGYYPTPDFKSKIELKPCMKLKAPITYIKDVKKGTSISYNNNYITTKESTKIATVSIGYGDGIRRSLSNGGNVVINNKLAPIIGTICMDEFMIDITDIPDVKTGDYVYLWDNSLITVEDIAKIYDTINYEVFTPLSSRIVRKFID